MISFVIPLHNHLAQTQAMLSSLQDCMPAAIEYEIIFVDDASSDGTPVWLKSLIDSHITYLTNDCNRGYAVSNNAGVDVAKGNVLALLNNDLLLTPDWIEPMLAALHSPALNAGLVGNVQYRVGYGAVDHAGFALSPFAQLHHVHTIPQAPLVNSFAVTGACILLRKADFWLWVALMKRMSMDVKILTCASNYKRLTKKSIWQATAEFNTTSV